MQRSWHWTVLGAAMALAAVAGPARCQNVAGSVKATIVDAAAAAVPGAQATLTNTSTALAIKGSSNALGIVVFPGIQAGVYSLTVQAAGFQQYVRNALVPLWAAEFRSREGFSLNYTYELPDPGKKLGNKRTTPLTTRSSRTSTPRPGSMPPASR